MNSGGFGGSGPGQWQSQVNGPDANMMMQQIQQLQQTVRELQSGGPGTPGDFPPGTQGMSNYMSSNMEEEEELELGVTVRTRGREDLMKIVRSILKSKLFSLSPTFHQIWQIQIHCFMLLRSLELWPKLRFYTTRETLLSFR